LSPANLAGDNAKFPGKECEKLIAMVFYVAKAFEPSIIYIDEAEKVWPAKKKKKKGQKKKSKDEMLKDPARMKKALVKWRTKWVVDDTRITVIGCTSEPQEGGKKDFKKFFDKSIYFPFPDYTTRRLMWKTFIN
jgi:SpoVK/Ycf46/Vps4 family AAA+-type ATPase